MLMSIAVSAVVTPSRLLRLALFAYAAACCGAAAALLRASERFHFPWWLAGLCVLAAAVAVRATVPAATTRRIDISGLGQLRVTVQQSMGGTAPRALMQLLPGSTVWPNALLLLLRDAGSGQTSVLMILPDSLPPEQFRKLGVSLRAIARRDKEFSGKHKIH